jgi:hypothetical protein
MIYNKFIKLIIEYVSIITRFACAYQLAIQQCFSFTTNQHQPEPVNQKPSSEQGE